MCVRVCVWSCEGAAYPSIACGPKYPLSFITYLAQSAHCHVTISACLSENTITAYILYIFIWFSHKTNNPNPSGIPVKFSQPMIHCTTLFGKCHFLGMWISTCLEDDTCVCRGGSVREKTGWSSKTSKQLEAHQVKRQRPECHLHNSLQSHPSMHTVTCVSAGSTHSSSVKLPRVECFRNNKRKSRFPSSACLHVYHDVFCEVLLYFALK